MTTPQPVSEVAIIGISGRFPQARDLESFWDNLKNGKDCISEVPKDRWDHDAYYDADKTAAGQSLQQNGVASLTGWRSSIRCFSTSRPVKRRSPTPKNDCSCNAFTIPWKMPVTPGKVWAKPSPTSSVRLPANVGVFVGVMYEEYQLYGAEAQTIDYNIAAGGIPASIANRVSYWCNFQGPSMAVDTMCSSSLSAIHLALQHIQSGACDAAIAGGVNVTLHPNKYLFLSQGQFVSSKGRCESFGEGGDGYVPSEGVGAVMLKPLAAAQNDGDNIYAIVKATALNHGGRTNGYTVPNPAAQAMVIAKALENADINPRTISYIEAHGTGTSLGDPIEIAGLTKAFGQLGREG